MKNKSNSIVTITMNPSIDMEARVGRVVPEEKLRCEVSRFDPGGGGINVSRVIKELGGSSLCFYLAGGNYGDRLEKLVSKAGIKNKRFQTRSETRENLVFSETVSDKQYRFIMPSGSSSPDEWQPIIEYLSNLKPIPHFVVSSGSLPSGVDDVYFEKLSSFCAKGGSKLIIDTSGPFLRSISELDVYMLKINRNEFEELTGENIKSTNDIKDLASKITDEGKIKGLVVSLGAKGAIVATRGEYKYIEAPEAEVSSVVGAGDSMLAGIVLKLVQGRGLIQSAVYGVAAGTAAVLTPGTELCRHEDVEKIYDQMLMN